MNAQPTVQIRVGPQVYQRPTILVTPPATLVSRDMALSRDALRCWSRWIRDTLAPLVAENGEENLSPTNVANLKLFLNDLRETFVELDDLKFSRIHNALIEISSPRSRWPHDIVREAKVLLRSLEKKFGSLRELRADLWAVGGRLEGVMKVGGWTETEKYENEGFHKELTQGRSLVVSKTSEAYYVVEGGMGPLKSLNFGDNGCGVGA